MDPEIIDKTKTVVHTAAGDMIVFGDRLSKFVVAHPKLAAILALAIGAAAGHFL